METKIKRKIIQVGDSLGIIIPKPLCEFLGFEKGNDIEVSGLKKLNSQQINKEGE